MIEEKSVPLPLVRAERMLLEVDSLVQNDDFDTGDVRILLDNASYEIKFAEAFGYGKKYKEFKELDDANNEIGKQTENDSHTDEKRTDKETEGQAREVQGRYLVKEFKLGDG